MEGSIGKNERRILAIGILFAAVGIIALIITFMQPSVRDERARAADDIFASQAELDAKAKVLSELSASDTSGAQMPEEEKLKVLESLREE